MIEWIKSIHSIHQINRHYHVNQTSVVSFLFSFFAYPSRSVLKKQINQLSDLFFHLYLFIYDFKILNVSLFCLRHDALNEQLLIVP